jgi:two-component system, chemotaxis family, chemotaxis protein CheY
MPVVVVGDADTMIAVVSKLLRQLGFLDVDGARDGATALNNMRAKRLGLVISDWNMESMTGYDFFREVRSNPGLKRTLVIVVSGDSKERERGRSKKSRHGCLSRRAIRSRDVESKN